MYQLPSIPNHTDWSTVKYIDPSAPVNGVGTEVSPYNTLQGLTLLENCAYLIKRGTQLNERIDKTLPRVYIGSYGAGPMPILKGGIRVRGLSYEYTIRGIDLKAARTEQGVTVQAPLMHERGAGDIENGIVAFCRITGLDEGGGYPENAINHLGTNFILYNNELTACWTNGIWLGGDINVKIIRNWIHRINIKGETGTDGNGDVIQAIYKNDNLYIAGNLLDKSNSTWKYSLMLSKADAYASQNVIAEYNTLIDALSGAGGAGLYWIPGGYPNGVYFNNSFRKNVINCISYDGKNLRDERAIQTQASELSLPSPYGIRDNHIINSQTPYLYPQSLDPQLDPSNLIFNSVSNYNNYLSSNPEIGLYGSDIERSTFLQDNDNPPVVITTPYTRPTVPKLADWTATKYIDPTAGVNGDGSESSPYNTLQGISIEPGTAYLIKEGTTLNEWVKKTWTNNYVGTWGEGNKATLKGFNIEAATDGLSIIGLKLLREGTGTDGVAPDSSIIVLESTANNVFIYNNIIWGIYNPDNPIEAYRYPAMAFNGKCDNLTIFNNHIGDVGSKLIYVVGHNFKFVRNYIFNVNRAAWGGAPQNQDEGVGHGNAFSFRFWRENVYIAGNYFDGARDFVYRTDTAWKSGFDVMLGIDNMTPNNMVMEYNTIIGPPKDVEGNGSLHYQPPYENKFRFNVIDASLKGTNEGKIPVLGGSWNERSAAEAGTDFGIRNNHIIKFNSNQDLAWPQSAIDYVSEPDRNNIVYNNYQSYINDITKAKWGSDIDPDTFLSEINSDPVIPSQFILNTLTIGSGQVLKSPNKTEYNANEIVQLTATAATGYKFKLWSNDLGSSNIISILMDGSKSVTAIFEKTSLPETISSIDFSGKTTTSQLDSIDLIRNKIKENLNYLYNVNLGLNIDYTVPKIAVGDTGADLITITNSMHTKEANEINNLIANASITLEEIVEEHITQGITEQEYILAINNHIEQVNAKLIGILNNGNYIPVGATYSVQQLSSEGANDGEILFSNPTGGTGSFEYSINGGSSWSSTLHFTNLIEGSYTLMVRDKIVTSNQSEISSILITHSRITINLTDIIETGTLIQI